MSFATGLFSFMGGLSQQYREEVEATAATAAVEHEKWTSEQEFEREKFESGEEQFQTTQSFLEGQEKTGKLEQRAEMLFKRQEFKQKTKQEDIEHTFNVEKFNQANIEWREGFDEKVRATKVKENDLTSRFKLDEKIFALDEKEGTNQVQQFGDKLGLSKDELELQRDKLTEIVRHNMKEESIAEMEALLEAEEGTITYKGKSSDNDIKITPRAGETQVERLVNNLTAYFDLTNEKVKELSPEGRLDLLQDITADIMLLKDFSYNKEKNIWNNYLAQLGPLFEIDIAQEALGNVIDSMKEDSKKTFKDNGVEADMTSLEFGDTIIGSSAISYKKATQEAGFETPEQLVASLDSLIAHDNTVKLYTDDLSPFSSHEKIITTLKQEGISLSILKLSPQLDYLQESQFGSIPNKNFYTQLVMEAEELGIIDENGNGFKSLINFIYKVMPEGEKGPVLMTGGVRKLKDMGVDIDIKGADAQARAANTAIVTINQIINILNATDPENYGMPLKAAALIEKARNTFHGMANLITKISSEDDATPWKNNVTRQKYINQLTNLQKIVGSGDTLKSMAATNARLQYLKFSLAYQMSMALQGGSGGRTISDQDVENMLKALQMDGIMGDPFQVKASLDTIKTFMEGIYHIAKFESLGTTKGYRAREHTINLMNAMNIVNEESLANELNEKIYGIEKAENLGGNVNMNFFRSSDGFNIEMSTDGIPVYIKWDGYSPNKKEAYVMSQDEFAEFVNRAKEKGEDVSNYIEEDGTVKQIPQYSLGEVMHRGIALTKTYSDLLVPSEGI